MISWGVLGTANIAVERMIPAIAEAPGAECRAIASRDRQRAETEAVRLGIERAYGSYDDLLADDSVDCVYIPLPNQLHVEWAEKALRAGKAVLCEKPLALTAHEVRKLIKVREETGGLIEEALVFRNHPQWAVIDDALKSEKIGRPLAVHGTIAKRFLDPTDIRNQAGLGGGATYDLAVYVLAACNLVFGRAPTRVTAMMDIDERFGIDRLTTAVLDYDECHASFTASSQGGTSAWATHQQFSVLGSKGWLNLNFPYAQARPTGCAMMIGDLCSVGTFPTEVREFEPVNQYALQVERFSALVRGDTVKEWPIEDSLMTLQTIEALFTSAREMRWINL